MIPLRLGQIAEILNTTAPADLAERLVAEVSTDTREVAAGQLFFALSGPRFDGHDFVGVAIERGAAAAVVREDFAGPASWPVLRVPDVLAALQGLAQAHRRMLSAKVLGVTGSNGKTTVKNMLAHVLDSRLRGRASRKSFNNHVGVPLTLLSAQPDDDFLVVEMGTSAPGEIRRLAELAEPDVGVLTSVGYAHIERLGGLDGVYREKMALFDHVRPGGVGVVNARAVDGRGVLPRAGELRWLTFGDHPDADVQVRDICGDLQHTFATIDDRHLLRLRVPGAHNAVNAAAVFVVCRHLGLDADEILCALSRFELPDLRLNVRRFGEVTVIDDCYNANPTSMEAALHVLASSGAGRRVFVAGRMAELGRDSARLHADLGRRAAGLGIDLIVAIGEPTRELADAAVALGQATQVAYFAETNEAARELPGLLLAGDMVLIKGSRAAGLESLAGAIAEVFGVERAAATAA
jgi:UDP-N-acetylmuramoyl-tripeptide--D-alanyl-D-alanine ligase